MTVLTYENCEFMQDIINFFPIDKVDVNTGTYDQYLIDLIKTVKDNYLAGNFQVAYFYIHLIFMSFIYYCIDKAFSLEPNRSEDIYYPINAYLGRQEKPNISTYSSIYEFSKIPEKEIFKVFRCVGMNDEDVRAFSRCVSDRDCYAHATGKGNITEEQFIIQLDTVKKNMKAIQKFFDNYLLKKYIGFLLKKYKTLYSDLEAIFEDYIEADSLSINNLYFISNLGLSKYRKKNEVFKSNYRYIKNIHCAFIEFCRERFVIEINGCCNEWIVNDFYCFYKYKGNPDGYIENVLGLDGYSHIKDGGEWPLYYCPECGDNQLVYDAEKERFICFNCENDWNSEIRFCDSCGQPYSVKYEEISKCDDCFQYLLDKD